MVKPFFIFVAPLKISVQMKIRQGEDTVPIRRIGGEVRHIPGGKHIHPSPNPNAAFLREDL
jgi:hypothetical protein